MKYLALILTFCSVSGALSSSLISPCKVSDLTCIEKTVNVALPQIFNGIPELGIESSDPQFLEIIEINLPTSKFTLYNSTLFGLKNKISNLKINEDITTIHCEVYYPVLKMNGQYTGNGHLNTMPVKGEGGFRIESANISLILDFEIEKIQGSDRKNHLFISNFKIKSMPLGVKFQFDNMFDGQKELADNFHKFLREHWREVTELFQYPLWNAVLNKVISNVNKYLETVMMDDILLNVLKKPKVHTSIIHL